MGPRLFYVSLGLGVLTAAIKSKSKVQKHGPDGWRFFTRINRNLLVMVQYVSDETLASDPWDRSR